VEHTRQVVYLDDGEMAVLSPDGFIPATIRPEPVDKAIHEVEWDSARSRRAATTIS
jgi:glucosamine--fructose-6-phosphate aminotransferase (isomerizing)